MDNRPAPPAAYAWSRRASLVLLAVLLLVVAGAALLGRGLVTNLNVNRAPLESLSLDQRVIHLADQLQCLVCEGESVAFSNSRLAVEMRAITSEKLAAGESEAQIKSYFVDRYGIRILREPPRTGLNAWLWLLPIIGFALASAWLIGLLWRMARRRPAGEASLAQMAEADGETPANDNALADDDALALDDSVRELLVQYDEELFA